MTIDYRLSDDPTEQQFDVIHGFLATSYWARGIAEETVRRALAGSLCVGAFAGDAQVGFARVVTDRATIAYLADVFVLEPHRGHGLGRQMVEMLHAHPDLQSLRRWLLTTRDAHPLYASLGWAPIDRPERFMQRHFPDCYQGDVTE